MLALLRQTAPPTAVDAIEHLIAPRCELLKELAGTLAGSGPERVTDVQFPALNS